MAYGDGSAIIKLIDQVGTAQDDVAAPEEGATIIYTTEQGLVLERSPLTEGLGVRQWFLDQPYLLGGSESVSLSSEPVSLLAEPFTVPDDIDASLPTIYRLELQVYVDGFSPDESSIGILVQPYVDGESVLPPSLVPCDAASGVGGTFVTFFVTANVAGLEVDVRAYTINGSDNANAFVAYGAIKRVLRLSGLP